MKITRIYLKNLNSLYGEFSLNLEEEPFASTGIFAITGATGAGKSTILDAMTLALYGRAARYENKPNPENMMSRGTGECQADIEFVVPAGKFRASWQLKRARSKSDGKVQPVQRYLYNEAGHVLAQKVNEVDELIEKLTGLSADRFFRSVLLAQGEFVKFLKASPDERASLLESLTGTEIYSLLSKKAHQIASEKENSILLREKELEGIKLYEPLELEALESKRGLLIVSLKENSFSLQTVLSQIDLANQLKKHLFDLELNKKATILLQKEDQAFTIPFLRLKAYRKAIAFQRDLYEWQAVESSLKVKSSRSLRAETECNEKRNSLGVFQKAIFDQVTAKHFELSDSLLEQNTKICNKKKLFEQTKMWLQNNMQDSLLEKDIVPLCQHIDNLAYHRKTTAHLKVSVKTLQTELQELDVSHLQLVKEKAILEQQLQALLLDDEITEDSLFLLSKKLESQFIKLLEGEKALKLIILLGPCINSATNEVASIAEEIDKLEQAFLVLKSKEVVLLKEVEQARLYIHLDGHRQNLHAGESCPLCGALEHPLVKEYRPQELKENEVALIEVQNEKEKISKKITLLQLDQATKKEFIKGKNSECHRARQVLIDLKMESLTLEDFCVEIESSKTLMAQHATTQKLLKEKNRLVNIFVRVKEKGAVLEDNIDSLTSKLMLAKEQTLKGSQEIEKKEKDLESYLKNYNLPVPLANEEKETFTLLEKRRDRFKDQVFISQSLDKELSELDSISKTSLQTLESLNNQLAKLNKLKSTYHLESKTSDQTSTRFRWSTIEEALDEMKATEEQLKYCFLRLEECRQEHDLEKVKEKQSQAHLITKLKNSEFNSIADLQEALMRPDEAEKIEEKEKELQNQKAELKGQIQLIEESLAKLKDKDAPSEDKLDSLVEERMKIETILVEHQRELTTTENKLQNDRDNRKKHASFYEVYIQEKKKLVIWKKLSNLIGSYDGKVFKKFAQGLTLDLLIYHANKHLISLNNRYQLKRVGQDQIELDIEDLYQAGAIRPTASLSGGESFLTSLALALGLSDLAGNNVRIDSLFIDEGFGSLDPETLETAVQALESLRSKNKKIGLISHIELLQERISTQIVLRKESGGRSTLSIRS